jgi:alkaline phosphatase D
MTGTWNRRQVLRTGAAATLGSVAAQSLYAGRAAAFVPTGRPVLTYGVQSGDAVAGTAIVWTRADRTSRMLVEVSERPDLRHARTLRGPLLTPDTDFTGKVRVHGVAPGQRLFYRVRAEADHGRTSEPATGSLIVPGRRHGIRFVWTGDINGQGWGINPDIGGMRIFRAMREVRPDFYLCSGDTIYADNPIAETQTLPDGRVYRNLTTEAKSHVAQTLDDFRGAFAYNLLDANLRALAAEVPQVNQWDDHEVHNNWYPGQVLADDRYTEKRVDVLAARSRQAFFEYLPLTPSPLIYRKLSYGPLLDLFILDMRTYKDVNDGNVYTDPTRGMLGHAQREWLIHELTTSRATWKVIANDLPLGLVVPDGPTAFEGVAQGNGGAPLGRELEFAQVLRTAHQRGVDNLVFLTADVHYTAAHHYDPARAAVGDFTPFWEFVSGPANAGAFGPNALDATFGPQQVFVRTPTRANASPLEGFQNFGEVEIDGYSRELTVRLRDQDNTVLWSTTLPAR